jgi:hypothetical protein
MEHIPFFKLRFLKFIFIKNILKYFFYFLKFIFNINSSKFKNINKLNFNRSHSLCRSPKRVLKTFHGSGNVQ